MKTQMLRVIAVTLALLIVLVLLAPKNAYAADCTSTKTGNWNDPSAWTCGAIPVANDNVTILSTHTITLTQNEAVNNIVVQSASGTRLAGAFTIEVNGTLNSDASNPVANIIASEATVRFVGSTGRALFGSQWGATTTGLVFEVALGSGTVGTATTNIKARSMTITSGTFQVSADLRPDSGSANTGTLVIANGATVIVSGSVSRTGTLTATCSSIDINGTLELGGTNISALNINVNNGGKLKSTRAAGHTVTGTLTYANGATLEYAGTATQATGQELTSGLSNLTINNSSGVTLNANAMVNGILHLQAGNLSTGTSTLTLGSAATVTGATDVVGSVKRAHTFAAGTPYAFGNPYVSINFAAGGAFPSDVTVTLTKTVPITLTNAVQRHYAITPNGGGVYSATVRLHYLDTELNSNPEENLQLWRRDGSRWVLQAKSDYNLDNNWLERENVTQFSDWAIAKDADPTAVALSSFAARSEAQSAALPALLGALGAAAALGAGAYFARQRLRSNKVS